MVWAVGELRHTSAGVVLCLEEGGRYVGGSDISSRHDARTG